MQGCLLQKLTEKTNKTKIKKLQWSLTACILVPKPKPELKLQSLMSLTSDIMEQGPRKSQKEKLISSGASCVWLQLDLQGAPCSCLVKAEFPLLNPLMWKRKLPLWKEKLEKSYFLPFPPISRPFSSVEIQIKFTHKHSLSCSPLQCHGLFRMMHRVTSTQTLFRESKRMSNIRSRQC